MIVAFAQSCNTPFANIGIDLGGPTIGATAGKYGFNNALAIPGVTVAASNFTAESDPSFTAFDAIGQHDTTETPLQEAMIAATVANGGVLMKPYLIDQVTASDLSVVQQTQPQVLSQPISRHRRRLREADDDRGGAGPRWHRLPVQPERAERPEDRRARPEPRRTASAPNLTRFSPLSHPLTTLRSPSAS